MLLIRRERVLQLLGISENKLRAMIRAGAIPAPTHIPRQGKPMQLWDLDELRRWAGARLAEEGLDPAAILIRAAGGTLPAASYRPTVPMRQEVTA